MPSVVPRTKMISRGSAAPRKRHTFCAGLLVVAGGPFAEQVDGAMDVGVVVAVVVLQGVEHGLRLLRGGRVVEVDERFAVDLLTQDREVLADAHHVETAGGRTGTGRELARATGG